MSSIKTLIQFWAYAVLCVLVILGNLAVCVFVPGSHSMRTLTKTLLLNLAIADLCFGMLKMAELATLKTVSEPHVIVKFCQASIFTTFLCCGVSIIILAAIAGERYIAVVKPLKYYRQRNRKPKHLACGVVAIWLVTAAIMVLSVYVYMDNAPEVTNNSESPFCAINLKSWNTFAYIHIAVVGIFYLVLPVVIVVFSYTMVIRKLWATGIENNRSSSPSRLTTSRRKLTKLLIAITAIFVACWLAIVINDILYIAGYDNRDFESLTMFLVMFKSATDPALYVFHGVDSRRSFNKTCCFTRLRKKRSKGRLNLSGQMRVPQLWTKRNITVSKATTGTFLACREGKLSVR